MQASSTAAEGYYASGSSRNLAGDKQVLQLVLECGCDVNCRNGRHETPLMVAMISIHNLERRRAVISLLIQNGADVNSRNLRGQTPLIYACVLGQLDSVFTLMTNKHLDCNIQDFEGNTALMYACSLGLLDVVQVLADAHSRNLIHLDFNTTNNEGLTALLYARDYLYDDIAQVLLNSMGVENSLICITRKQENEDKETTQKSKTRIKQLVENIEHPPKDNTNETNPKADETDTEFKLDPVEVPSELIGSNKDVEDSSVEDKTTLGMHAAEVKDDYVKTLLDIADTSHEETKSILDINELFITEALNLPKQTECVSKKSKRKGKQRRKRNKLKSEELLETPKLPLFDKPLSSQTFFSDELAAADRKYSQHANNTRDIQEDEVTLIRRIVMDNAKRKLYKTLDLARNQPFIELDTGKIDCLNLDAEAKGNLLGRTVWSVYGAPLPPIPIDDETVARVIAEISDVRKYLERAKYYQGRLVNLDPELWCILESMRPNE